MSELKTIPSYLPPRNTSSQNKKVYKYIPKKIFQTWETNKVTPGMYDAVHTWIDKNPDWEYHFFDKDDRRNFIKDNFPKKVLDAYDNLIPGSFKADLWRVCVLYISGGLYVDNKCVLLSATLNEVIPFDVEFLSLKDRNLKSNDSLGNIVSGFICSKPKHPFLKKAIDMFVEYVEKAWYSTNPISCAGPGVLGKSINICIGCLENSQILPGIHNISGINFELWPIPNFDSKVAITDKNIPFFNLEYKNYRKELYSNIHHDLSKNYDLCWYFNKVYNHGRVVRPKFTIKGRVLFGLKKIKRYFTYLKIKYNLNISGKLFSRLI
jgi:hypothetical protein